MPIADHPNVVPLVRHEPGRDDPAARETWYQELLDALPAAIYSTDAEGRITYYNQAAAELAGTQPRLGVDEWCVTWRLFHPDGTPLPHDRCPMAVALETGEPVRGVEAIAERPDGTRIPFIPFPTPLKDDHGRVIGAVNMLVDISERKRAEEQQKVLIDELNHRVKNTLATVQSIAFQTLHSPETGAFAETFESRLIALSKAHDLLSDRRWDGAALHDILGQELQPFVSEDPNRVRLDGPILILPPRLALAMSMALHELTTNAVRYGALSGHEGRLDVSWRVRMADDGPPDQLTLAWIESGGPPVSPPQHKGFGARLLERTVRGDIDGRCELQFPTDGVRCDIVVPLERAP